MTSSLCDLMREADEDFDDLIAVIEAERDDQDKVGVGYS